MKLYWKFVATPQIHSQNAKVEQARKEDQSWFIMHEYDFVFDAFTFDGYAIFIKIKTSNLRHAKTYTAHPNWTWLAMGKDL